jgi:aminopeptidase C
VITLKQIAQERPVGLAHPSQKDWDRYVKLFNDYSAPSIAKIMELLRMNNELAVSRCPRKLFTTKTRMIANSIFRSAGENVRLLESRETIDKPLQEQVFHLFNVKLDKPPLKPA